MLLNSSEKARAIIFFDEDRLAGELLYSEFEKHWCHSGQVLPFAFFASEITQLTLDRVSRINRRSEKPKAPSDISRAQFTI